MKTLKFMLAAATAIGLASASQAADKMGDLELYSEDFNAMAAGAFNPASNPGFSLAEGEDCDLNIVDASGDKYLDVDGGTVPLLRAIDYSSDAAHPVDLSVAHRSLDIETKVQFTVTPYADSVTANDGDKLMIYLKEMTNGVGEVTGTNLMVKAAKYTKGDIMVPAAFVTNDYQLTGVTVNPGAWYDLKVTAQADVDGVVYFNIYIGNTQLAASESLYPGDEDNYKIPSLCGADASLTYVGFAGNGKVDDLKFTRYDLVTSINFTLTLGTGVESVDYTIAGVAGSTNATATLDVFPGDTITVTPIYAQGYVASSATASGLSGTFADGYTVNSGVASCSLEIVGEQEVTTVSFTLNLATGVSSVSFTVDGTPYEVTTATTNLSLNPGAVNYTATFDTANWYTGNANGSFTVAANGSYTVTATRESSSNVPASAAAAGITDGAFASAGSTELGKVIDWAVANGKTTTDVNAMTFANALSYTADEKSYLLNGTGLTEAQAEAALEIESIVYDDVKGEWVITSKAGSTLGNGSVQIWGADTLNGTFAPKTSGNKFFKAVLVK